MKKILKIIFTIVFVIGTIIFINKLIIDFSEDGFGVMLFAFAMFFLYLFSWIMPKKFFDFCWEFSKFSPDNFDYDTSFSKLENMSLGMLIISNIMLIIAFLII